MISYIGPNPWPLKVVKCSNAACTQFSSTTVDSDGYYTTSLAIGTDGYPVIAYHDYASGQLRVAKCGSTDCTLVSTTTVDSVGLYTSIAIGTDGYPVISYRGP
ncbi:unnamed protein product, partial [marine sediment metagenome]